VKIFGTPQPSPKEGTVFKKKKKKDSAEKRYQIIIDKQMIRTMTTVQRRCDNKQDARERWRRKIEKKKNQKNKIRATGDRRQK
jgi:hypothetical protein